MKKLKVLSLFDGMSCGQIALKKLGLTPDQYEYYASEIKPHGIKTTQHNFPDTIQIGDVTKVEFRNGVLKTEKGFFVIGEFDILIGGSPCTQFSIMCKTDKRTGLEGEASGLFYHYQRLLEETSPKYFLLENVASMKEEDKQTLDEYMGCHHIFIDSKDFSAQIRKRLYWTNIDTEHLTSYKKKEVKFPEVLVEGYTNRDKALCLLESHSRPTSTPYRMMRRFHKSFSNFIFKDENHYKESIKLFNSHFKGLKAAEADAKAITLGSDIEVFDGIRNLYAVEMERLQTVPEGYTNCVTELEAASLLGDGWTVDVIVELLRPVVQEFNKD